MDQTKIGSLLKKLRKEKGLTQEQLAETFNVAGRTVSRWENGYNMPDLSILIELADFYDVDIRELINGERKSETVTEEMKDTLEKIADYTDMEKENILKRHFVSIVGSAFIFLILYIILGFNLNNKNESLESFTILLPLLGLICTSTGLINIMQIKGNMSKNRLKKIRKIGLSLSIVLLILCAIVIILLVSI